jgi:hypothetical protein
MNNDNGDRLASNENWVVNFFDQILCTRERNPSARPGDEG